MSELFLTILGQYGLSVGGPVVTTIVLALVVRVLWREQQQQDQERVSDLKQQFQERLADKNAELSQVWSELRSERDEKRRVQAINEGLESLLRREQDLTRAALDEAKAWRGLHQEPHGRS